MGWKCVHSRPSPTCNGPTGALWGWGSTQALWWSGAVPHYGCDVNMIRRVHTVLGCPSLSCIHTGRTPSTEYMYIYFLTFSALEFSEQGLSDDKSLNVSVLEQIITLGTHSYFLQNTGCIKIRTTQNGTRVWYVPPLITDHLGWMSVFGFWLWQCRKWFFKVGFPSWHGVDGEPGLSEETAFWTSLSCVPLILSKNDKNDNSEAFSCCKLGFTRSGSFLCWQLS